MKVNSKNGQYEFIVTGPISENTEIFDYKIADAIEVIVDFDKMTFINSVGVKKWTFWAVNIVPGVANVYLKNCSGLIINQLNMIQGFMPRRGRVVSLKAPYMCSKCSYEKEYLLTLDKEFAYKAPGQEKKIELPKDLKCPKCASPMEEDFIVERFFKFLEM